MKPNFRWEKWKRLMEILYKPPSFWKRIWRFFLFQWRLQREGKWCSLLLPSRISVDLPLQCICNNIKRQQFLCILFLLAPLSLWLFYLISRFLKILKLKKIWYVHEFLISCFTYQTFIKIHKLIKQKLNKNSITHKIQLCIIKLWILKNTKQVRDL